MATIGFVIYGRETRELGLNLEFLRKVLTETVFLLICYKRGCLNKCSFFLFNYVINIHLYENVKQKPKVIT